MASEKNALAEELMAEGKLTPADYDEYQAIRIEKHRYRDRLVITGPTWLMRAPKQSLDDYLPKLADPETRDQARMDYANLPGGGLKPFFVVAAVLLERAESGRKCPVGDGTGDFVSGDPIIWQTGSIRPEPGWIYALGSDLSTAGGGDSTGVALVGVNPAGGAIELVFSLQIKAPPGTVMDYEPIRQLARDLRAAGFRLAAVGCDQHQSNAIMVLEKEGFQCCIVVHKDWYNGCYTLQALIVSGQFLYGLCDKVFIGEARELQRKGQRIDHLASGGECNSKDVWDAVVNALILAMAAAKEAHPEYLSQQDIRTYAPDAFTVPSLTAEESVLTEEERARRQLPNNGHALVAYVQCRYADKTDSDVVAVVLGAVRLRKPGARTTPNAKVIATWSMRKTPAELAGWLAGLQCDWNGKGFYGATAGQPVDVFLPDEKFVDQVDDAIVARGSTMRLGRLPEDTGKAVRISVLQTVARDGEVEFPESYGDTPALAQLVGTLVNYPWGSNDYALLALEGLSRAALGAGGPAIRASSKVVASPVASGDYDW